MRSVVVKDLTSSKNKDYLGTLTDFLVLWKISWALFPVLLATVWSPTRDGQNRLSALRVVHPPQKSLEEWPDTVIRSPFRQTKFDHSKKSFRLIQLYTIPNLEKCENSQ